MSASHLIATDLDRTLIYTRPAMGEEQFATVDPVCVEVYDNTPLSYMTSAAHQMLTVLAGQTIVVPTTTRTPEQYQRIALPGSPYQYAVVSNGGDILVNGRPDSAWRARIDAATGDTCVDVSTVVADVRRRIDDTWVSKLRVAADLFCYLVVDPSAQPVDFVAQWRSWCADRGWSVSQQGRKIYAMPNAVTKSAAIAEVRARLIEEGALRAENTLLAAGDGWLDAGLLECAHAAIRPSHGELHSLNWLRPHVDVTDLSGALASEQILRWLYRQVDPLADLARPARQDG